MRRAAQGFALLAALCLASCGYGPLSLRGSRLVGDEEAAAAAGREGRMNELELSQALQRVAADFSDRLSEIGDALPEDSALTERRELLQQLLIYDSAVLEIVTGPLPDTNFLDLLVFAEIAGDALTEQLIPGRLGQLGEPLVPAFAALRAQVWDLAEILLSEAERADLLELIESWQRDNEARARVEGVRFVEFATIAGEAAGRQAEEARGILHLVRAATQTADRAILLAEQGTFLLQRLPVLWRAHVRLGAKELSADALRFAGELSAQLEKVRALRPLLGDASELLTQLERTTAEAHRVAVIVTPPLAKSLDLLERGELDEALALTDRVTARTLTILEKLSAVLPEEEVPIEQLAAELTEAADAVFRRAVIYLGLLGICFSLSFWGAYYLAKRLLARRT